MLSKISLSTRLASKRFFSNPFLKPQSEWKAPVRVALTGSTGNIGYSAAFRIANGEMLGPDQPIILHMLDLPVMENALKGCQMELQDCAFPLLQEVVLCTDQNKGFKDVDYALLLGSKPRGPGMERADLLKDNGKIFIDTGKALNDNASRNIKTLVVGNPANTNCLILANYAPDIPQENFMAMTRLDHDRALGMIAQKLGVHIDDIHNFTIWGNHSPTMYPDITHAHLTDGRKLSDLLDQNWLVNEFTPAVQQRGKAIIDARGKSSAASAGNAAIAHMRDWVAGTNEWISMSVKTDGKVYGLPEGVVYSMPCTVANGKATVVEGLHNDEYSQKMMKNTLDELLGEREAVAHLL